MQSAHKKQVDELRKQQGRMMRELGDFRVHSRLMQPKIQKLGCFKWQNHIQTELLSHFHAIASCSFSDNVSMPTTLQQLDRIGRLLDKYSFMEQVSLLELAVWKAACIVQLDEEDDNESANEPKAKKRKLLDVLEWMSNGWKSQKSKTRRSNSIEVIIVAVLPFLKQEETEKTNHDSL